jgi:hypothetical protein
MWSPRKEGAVTGSRYVLVCLTCTTKREWVHVGADPGQTDGHVPVRSSVHMDARGAVCDANARSWWPEVTSSHHWAVLYACSAVSKTVHIFRTSPRAVHFCNSALTRPVYCCELLRWLEPFVTVGNLSFAAICWLSLSAWFPLSLVAFRELLPFETPSS